ncbi:MAG TPA: hypothetical protein DCG19_00580 [Cryomorphaceae bacterium]|nr:hypothetical protein [Owenweeksia sp.]MBF97757.1 hypothetical protein [Owenweeksia sp.]HAD95863.1 hypothetical protein [Cryomorphaceae bacterium]HBF21765.1 hypothetical protein [Cryomorphaceae bacterium]
MKTSHLFIHFSVFILPLCMYSQNAADILERSEKLDKDEKIFIEYRPDVLYLSHNVDGQYLTLSNPDDSALYLFSGDNANIYLSPLNPLTYSYTKQVIEAEDPVDKLASNTFSSLLDILKKGALLPGIEKALMFDPSAEFISPAEDLAADCDTIEDYIRALQDSLKNNHKTEINQVFKTLKELDFREKTVTQQKISKAEANRTAIKKHFDNIQELLTVTAQLIKEEKCKARCGKLDNNSIYQAFLNDLSTIFTEQKKRLNNLDSAFKMINEVVAEAEINVFGNRWFVNLANIQLKRGKIYQYTVQIYHSGYSLSEQNEIVATESKKLSGKTILLKRYRLFVPEVAVGVAYTSFEYKSFHTTADSTGQQYVAKPTINYASRLNVNALINFTLYLPNSDIHPLYQIGAGLNEGVPILFTGIGVRSHINGTNRLAISVGLAMTWLPQLNDLEVGDPVNDQDAIEKDLKYEFSWPPKAYISLQYNF